MSFKMIHSYCKWYKAFWQSNNRFIYRQNDALFLVLSILFIELYNLEIL